MNEIIEELIKLSDRLNDLSDEFCNLDRTLRFAINTAITKFQENRSPLEYVDPVESVDIPPAFNPVSIVNADEDVNAGIAHAFNTMVLPRTEDVPCPEDTAPIDVPYYIAPRAFPAADSPVIRYTK